MRICGLILLAVLISNIAMSQSIVGNVKRGPFLIAELSVKISDTSNLYKLKYLDAKSEILKSIEFNMNQIQIDSLYSTFYNMLSEKNGTSKDFEIGKHKVSVTTQKMMGLRNVLITLNESSNFGLNGNELNRLFNK